MLSLPELILKVKVDDAGAKASLKGLEKSANATSSGITSKFKSLGLSIGKFMAKAAAAGAAALGAAMIKIGKDALQAYSDFEQLQGGVEKIFGEDTAKTVEENAKRAFQTAGMSANEYMETVTGFSATLLKDLGGDTEKAAQYADMAIQDMSDNANTFGTDIKSIEAAYQGFAKGNATMLDNLKVGYGGTKTELLQLAKDMGVVDESIKSFDDMSFPDAIDAIHKVQEELNITGTTAKEASKTLEGSANAMKASWQNLLTAMGTGDDSEIQRAMEDFSSSVETYLQNLIPRVKIIIESMFNVLGEYINSIDWGAKINEILTKAGSFLSEGLPELFHNIVAKVTEWLSTESADGGGIMEGLKNLFKGLIAGLIKMLPDLLLLAADILVYIGELYQTLLEAIIESIANLFAKIWEVVGPYLEDLWNSIKTGVIDFFTGIWDWVKDKITTAWNFVKNIFETVVKTVKTVFNNIKSAIVDRITTAKDKISSVFNSIKSTVTDKITAIKDKVTSVFNAIKDKITGPIEKARDKVKSIIEKIKGFFDFKVKLPSIPLPHFGVSPAGWKISDLLTGSIPKLTIDWYKEGGFFNGGPTVLTGLGEAGPEYALPLNRQSLAPLAQMLNELQRQDKKSTSDDKVVVVYTTLEVDGRQIAKTTAPYMKKEITKISTADARQLGLI